MGFQFTPTPFNGTPAQANTALANFLISNGIEGFVNFVYDDGDGTGIPTIGAGYALLSYSPPSRGGGWPVWRLNPNYLADFQTAGINLTDPQKAALANALQAAMDALNQGDDTNYPFASSSGRNVLGWTISVEQAQKLALIALPNADQALKSWLGSDGAAVYNLLSGSTEKLALLSLAYNGWFRRGNRGGLRSALISENRAEAWWEVRYNTPRARNAARYNAARYYAEASIFGLYNPAVSSSDALQVYQMYAHHAIQVQT